MSGRSWTSSLASAFAVHPHGPTAVSDEVAAQLAERARRRSRTIAWTGVLGSLPLFYIDHWTSFAAGLWTQEPVQMQYFVWRVLSVGSLALYLLADYRTAWTAKTDRQLSGAFAVLAIVQAASFGIWFEVNPPSYAMFSFLLLLMAVLVHPPSRWSLVAYAMAVPIAGVGALIYGTAPNLVALTSVEFTLTVLLVVLVDRSIYHQSYRTIESTLLLGHANEQLSATLGELQETQARLVRSERRAERERISRDLHDSVGAQLSNLISGVQLARLSGDESGGTVTLDDLESDAREAMSQLRETVWALRSEAITVDALAAQIRRFGDVRARRNKMALSVRVEGDVDRALTADQALNLYRVCQEAIQNAVKHSGGATIRVVLTVTDATLVVNVDDDGVFTERDAGGADAPSGFGLESMQSRVDTLGGTLVIHSAGGTSIEVTTPLEIADSA